MRRFTLIALLSAAAVFGAATAGMKSGKAELKWAGSLAFGPDAVLFVGDSIGGSIYAIDTEDRTPGQAAKVEIKGTKEKNAAVPGTSADQISIPYPFQEGMKGAGIEIYHGSHGRFETNAPVRTFVAYQIQKQPYILAAYTCTPLVKIPVSDLKPGSKVKGTTIAELGNRNRPLDMIVYTKGEKHFILMANSSRGVMKLAADNLDTYQPITAHTEVAGVPYE